jgi:hypothetical protein
VNTSSIQYRAASAGKVILTATPNNWTITDGEI